MQAAARRIALSSDSDSQLIHVPILSGLETSKPTTGPSQRWLMEDDFESLKLNTDHVREMLVTATPRSETGEHR
jgi:hypothetical protein